MSATARSTIVCLASLASVICGSIACGREDVELAGWIARDSVVEDAGPSVPADGGRPLADAAPAPCEPAPAAPVCAVEGAACEADDDCCEGKCDDDTQRCVRSGPDCRAPGESCRGHEGECCGECDPITLRCLPGAPVPKGGACLPTAATCARNAECCSQLCVGDTCAPLPCTSTASTPTR
jgi:hypothetical protein